LALHYALYRITSPADRKDKSRRFNLDSTIGIRNQLFRAERIQAPLPRVRGGGSIVITVPLGGARM
jgi:hypothetical protein